MAILRSNEIWEMEIEEIQEKLIELKVELNKTVSKGAAAGVIDNPGQVRELKRTIARVLTILNEKHFYNGQVIVPDQVPITPELVIHF